MNPPYQNKKAKYPAVAIPANAPLEKGLSKELQSAGASVTSFPQEDLACGGYLSNAYFITRVESYEFLTVSDHNNEDITCLIVIREADDVAHIEQLTFSVDADTPIISLANAVLVLGPGAQRILLKVDTAII